MICVGIGCGSPDAPRVEEAMAAAAIRSERPTQDGLPDDLSRQTPLWERLREPTFRTSATAFRVYPGGQTATLSETTRRWEVGPDLDETQRASLHTSIESGAFFALASVMGEEDSDGRCARPHGGCWSWTATVDGRTHWVRRARTTPAEVTRIEANVR